MDRHRANVGVVVALVVVGAVLLVTPTSVDAASRKLKVVIDIDRVGPFQLFKQIPGNLLSPAMRAKRNYVLGYVADAQPFEGFQFTAPPVLVRIANGPFERYDKTRGIPRQLKAVRKRLAPRALALARSGKATVKMIIVMSPTITTRMGARVGSTLADLRRFYGPVEPFVVPGMYGDQDCLVRTPRLPSVTFMFSSCAAARRGKPVIRIVVWRRR